MARKSVESALKPYLQLLGRVPDQKIADQAGVSRAVTVAYRNRLGIEAYDGHRKGRGKSDEAEVAVPVVPPAAAPAKASKAPKAPKAAKAPKASKATKAAPVVEAAPAADSRSFRGRRSALDAYVNMLGTVADAEIAKLADVTAENVRTYRQRRGIGANWRGADAPARGRPAASAAPAAAAPAVAAAAPAAAVAAPAAAAAPAAVFAVEIESNGATQTFYILGNEISDAAASALAGAARRSGGRVVGVRRVGEVL